jgi:uncharacterized protein (DUF433 family)
VKRGERSPAVCADTAADRVEWAPEVRDRLAEFEYAGGLSLRWHLSGIDSPVVIDPRVSFGTPTVGGIPTWAISGRWRAGESIPELCSDFGLDESAVLSALQFEGNRVAA